MNDMKNLYTYLLELADLTVNIRRVSQKHRGSSKKATPISRLLYRTWNNSAI